MIRISRPATGPPSLKKLGKSQTDEDCAAYDACPSAYKSGLKKFPRKNYYRNQAVKKLLVVMNYSKCCYCEKKCPPENLHVEHFRPRGGVRQGLDQKADELPGYYWLAYFWDNLLLACLACNSMHKKTHFPLRNPEKRARSHHDEVSNEQALFVDPVGQDPRLHILFVDDAPESQSDEGRETIKGLGLRRPGLTEDRLEKIALIKAHLDILKLAALLPDYADGQEKAKKAREFIEAAKQPDAEFSSMVTDYVKKFGF